MQFDNPGVLRLKVVTEAEPSALVRVLQLLQSCNATPLRVMAQRIAIRGRTTGVLEIEIEVPASDLAPETLRFITAKINRLPTVLTAVAGK